MLTKAKALRLAHDAAAQCIESLLKDTKSLERRFASPEEAKQVIEALRELRSRHHRSSEPLPAEKVTIKIVLPEVSPEELRSFLDRQNLTKEGEAEP
jgi:hypothetical protein